MIAELATYASVLFAALAAFFWFTSVNASVPPEAGTDPLGKGTTIGKTILTTVGGKRVDLPATLVKQSRRNALGAICAGVASVCQAVALIATKFTWP